MKLKFGYDTSALSAVVNDQSLEMIMRSFYEGPTSKRFTKQTGIKSSEQLHYLTEELFFQADGGCTFNASGATAFSNKTLTVDDVKVQQSFCTRDLEGFWTERALKPGSNYDYAAFEADWSAYLSGLITEAMETALWQGNKSTGTGNNALWDGFIRKIDDATDEINGNPTGITTGTGITTSNILTILNGMVALNPIRNDDKPDLCFSMGNDTFKTTVQALMSANLYHYDGVSATAYETGSIALPGFGITIKRTPGLNGTNRIFLTRESNYVIGTDGQNDEEIFMLRESQETLGKMLLDIHFKCGTQIKFTNEVVSFKLV